jgi:hypothetical protein
MAIGLARMFGIRLPLNFDSPYRATNIVDFWRRWHMTLSRFLRDYVYFPLGGNRKGPTRRYVNLVTTMLLGGLWHGAGWTFVFWGGLHGLYLVVNHAWHRVWRRPIGAWWSLAVARSVTLLFVMIGWVFFRAETFTGAINVLTGLTVLPSTLSGALGPLAALGVSFTGPAIGAEDQMAVLWFVGWLAVLWWWPNTQQLMARFEPAFEYTAERHEPSALQRLAPFGYWRPSAVWAGVIGLAAAAALLSLTRVSEFLYFQF